MKSTRDHVIDVYRKRARHYDLTAYSYYLLGGREWGYRRKAVQALRPNRGGTVIEIGCGTGRNFSLLEEAVGPEGRIIGIDLTDAMLAQARHRVQARGWTNVNLVQADAGDYEFPAGVDGILSTFALSLVPECSQVIASGARALAHGGRWAVLDLQLPDNAHPVLARAWLSTVRPFAVTEEWVRRRPWEAIRSAMQGHLADFSWTEFYLGTVLLAAGTAKQGRNRP